ncbi:hypothetical protein HA402_009131 [Bradysia odoriphaga]|nr:hypothetical protein HA402_009131 [Bradysia odoriphaga]
MKSDDKMAMRKANENSFKKLKRYVTVEPVLFAIAIPYCLLAICLQNLTLEKACRVNLGFPDLVCDHMMDKALNNIHCGDVSDRQDALMFAQYNSTASLATYENDTVKSSTKFDNTNHDFEMEVCRAERESQKLGSSINAYIAPFDSTIGIVLVLFAGSWSDRSGRRKPCILIPQLGEFLGQFAALIAAIFMKQLPVEFNTILGAFFPAIGGGWTLMSIGLFSYLTEVTEEKDRVFRFGIMYQIYPIISICTLPFSGILYQKLGYIKLISICMLINVIGVLYIVFVVKEATPRTKDDKEMVVMLPSETKPLEHIATVEPSTTNSNGNICSNVINDCITVIVRKRSGNGRKIVHLILIIVGLSQALDFEYVNEYYFVRTKLNWEALEEAPYAAYGSATFFIGTTFMIAVMSKIFKISDTMLALISSSFSAVSKFVCITVTTTFMLYVAKTLDMFGGIRSLVVRSIISTVVDNKEIGQFISI